MTYGFKIVQEMISGLSGLMDRKGYRSIEDFRGRAVANVTDWQYLNLNYVAKAEIHQDLCIKCGRCHIVCEDTSHQAIFATVDGDAQVRRQRSRMRRLQPLRAGLPGRELHHARPQDAGLDPRTGLPYARPPLPWTAHPNNPRRRRRSSGPSGQASRRSVRYWTTPDSEASR